VVTEGGVAPAAVVIQGETIADVTGPDSIPSDMPLVDLGSCVLMPGLVDCHVHLNDPGHADWEGFPDGTRAAAAGGVTTLVDMPLNSVPVTTDRGALEKKIEAARGRLWVDCGLWGGLVPENGDRISDLVEGGVLGIKAFLVPSGLDAFGAVAEAELRSAMLQLAARRVPLLVHAELACGCGGVKAPGSASSYPRYLASRPATWEEAAIALVIRLVRETSCAAHVVHLSAASALDLIHRARNEGLPVTVETCPHYLAISAEDIAEGNTLLKCAPPIREGENRDRLWRGLADGTIDFIVSDHSPCPPQRKCFAAGDFIEAWGGISSLGLALPLVWTEARRRGHGLEDLAQWLSGGPAQLAGLADRKGAIAAGRDADFVAWDPERRFRVTPEDLHTRHRVSPYLGRELEGMVLSTWLRGQRAFQREGDSFSVPRGQLLLGRDSTA